MMRLLKDFWHWLWTGEVAKPEVRLIPVMVDGVTVGHLKPNDDLWRMVHGRTYKCVFVPGRIFNFCTMEKT